MSNDHCQESFQLHALLFCIIMISPWANSCSNTMLSKDIKHAQIVKIMAFDRLPKKGKTPLRLTSGQVYEQVKNIDINFDKSYAYANDKTQWKKNIHIHLSSILAALVCET